MNPIVLLAALLLASLQAHAEPRDALVYELKSSVVKIHVINPQGHHGVGSGIVVDKDHVATNCHVVANAQGVRVSKFGESYSPIGIKADWKHDLCLLQFRNLDLPPVRLGSSRQLQYKQPVFTISFPNNAKKPLTTYGVVTGLYPYDNGNIIRATADFRLGGSGGPLFAEDGTLVGLTTMKSPGRNAFYYNIPVDWIRPLLEQEPQAAAVQQEPPFWDAPEEMRPFFMRIVHPMQTGDWKTLESISLAWVKAEPDCAEAWYALGVAQQNLGNLQDAAYDLHQAISISLMHPEANQAQSELMERME
ncbi:MAG TPA: trypsin-like peptidase domain-containing protein [Methylophilaceae bacterium]